MIPPERQPPPRASSPDHPPPPQDRAQDRAAVERLRRLAGWLDDRFRIPGTGIRFGLDGVAGLLPGVGDAATTLLSAYIVAEAWRLGAPAPLLARMAFNVAADMAVGAIPVLGDLFDVGFKANRRNVDLLLRHLGDTDRPGARRQL